MGDRMKRMSFCWLVIAATIALVWTATPTVPQDLPPTEPIFRVETGMHEAPIRRIGVNGNCSLIVTGSEDKTARLWALAGDGTPELLRVLRVPIGPGNDGKVFAVALSPDGHFAGVAGWNRSGGDDWVYIFDTTTGKLIRRLGVGNVVFHLTFSPDGRYLAGTMAGGEGVRVWETVGWTLVGKDTEYDGRASYGATFDDADNLYTVAYDGGGTLRRYGQKMKLDVKVKTVGADRPYSVAINPSGDELAVGFTDKSAVDIYGATDLRHVFTTELAGGGGSNLGRVAWSSDGNDLVAGGRFQNAQGDNLIRILDRKGRGWVRDVPVSQDTVEQILPCPDGMAVGTQDPAFGLISLTGEKRVWLDSDIADMRGKLSESFAVSHDGSKVRFGLGSGSKNPVQFDVVSARLTDGRDWANDFFKPNVTRLSLSDWQDKDNPKLNGKPLAIEQGERARAVAIDAVAQRFVLGTDSHVRAYDRNGDLLWQKPVPSIAYGVNIPRDGKAVVVAYYDGTIRWHRLSDGGEVLSLFVNAKTREWVLWTPQGYYTSSVNGDQMIGWHLNKGWDQAGEFVTAARLKKQLYRPDIVKRAFELADADAAVRQAGLSGFKLADLTSHTPPEFHIIDPGDNTHADKSPVAVRLELGETNDPVTGFDIKVNGRQVTPRDVRDIDQPTKDAETRTLNIPMQKGENHIQVVAHNVVGETVQDLLLYLDHEGVLDKKGRLFIVAVGVDKYTKLGDRYTLRYAGADARLMVDTLTKKAGPLHTEAISKLLVTDGDTPPTKANIEDALLAFRDARPEDTVVLFLASHGVNEGADYLMIPEDAERTEAGYWRPSSVMQWSVLQKALQDAQGNRIMFVDTCHSSGAYNSRLVKDAADANIVVFSATDKDTEAQETSKLGHGVFTYALSQGLSGEADPRKKGSVSIFALSDYVSDEVKLLTNDEQEPVFSGSGVKNFVLATP
jgi:WD40 repeat protein